MQPFTAYQLEKAVRDHADKIIDLGAGASVYEDEALLAHVQDVMRPIPHVFLLLPSPDLDESIQILKYRPRGTINGLDSNLYLLNHHAYYDLAKITISTEGTRPEETRNEILSRMAA